MPDDITIPIFTDVDIISARQRGRALAEQVGFSTTDQALVATAISEIARNILEYAQRGEVILRVVAEGARSGILVIAKDEGPGIADVRLAMQDGYSTGRSLGLGLPGAKRLVDEFDIQSEVGKGTTIIMKKWKR